VTFGGKKFCRWIDSKQKGNGKHINHKKPRTIKGIRKHKMERKEMVQM